MNLAERTQALIALLEQQRLGDRGGVIGEARTAASRKLKEAHAAARNRVRKLMEEERAAAKLQVDSARAHLQSELRGSRRRETLERLAAARKRLREVLGERWRNAARTRWLLQYAAFACELLPRKDWVVHHPADWTSADAKSLEDRLAAAGLPVPVYELDDSIEAGLRFSSGDAMLDATLDGLLLDGYEADARLLHFLEAAS